jgi:hypothetical protein
MLNSTVQRQAINRLTKQLEHLNTDTRTLTFETRIGKMKGPNITIKQLQRIEPRSINAWIAQLRLLIETNNHNDPETMVILKMVTSNGLHHIFEAKQTRETMFDAILNAAFPTNDLYIYEKVLKTIKMRDFERVTKFENKFFEKIKFANFCLKNKKNTRQERSLTSLKTTSRINNVS